MKFNFLLMLSLSLSFWACTPENPDSDIQKPGRGFLLQNPDNSNNSNSRYAGTPTQYRSIEQKNGKNIDNLSAIIYLPKRRTYLGLRNNDRYMHELDQNLKVLRDLPIVNFNSSEIDLEGLTLLEENEQDVILALVNENAEMFIGTWNFTKNKIDRSLFKKIIFDTGNIGSNEGPEGICFDSTNRNFYVAYEGSGGSDTKIVEFPLPLVIEEGMNIEDSVSTPFDIASKIKLGDIADIAIDPETSHLMILSEEDRTVYEFERSGVYLGKQKLDKKIQFEGLYFKEKDLILAAEPNIIQIFSSQVP